MKSALSILLLSLCASGQQAKLCSPTSLCAAEGQQALNQEKPSIAKHTLPHDGPCHDGEFSNTIAITTWPMSYLTTCQTQPGWETMVPKIQPPPADPAKPTVTEVPVTKKVYSCQKGWKLQTWTEVSSKWSSDRGKYDVVFAYFDFPTASIYSDGQDYVNVPGHPPRCVKDESAASKPDTRKSHAVATVPRKEKADIKYRLSDYGGSVQVEGYCITGAPWVMGCPQACDDGAVPCLPDPPLPKGLQKGAK